ncbi:MAG: hypothetical protein KKD31_18695 [Bacteroidetes bacterium]|nr:hypothetical protein [Bacteroidota bacterium]
MKKAVLFILFVLPMMVFAQSKKDIKNAGITKCTVYSYSAADGKDVKKLESVTKFNEDGRDAEETRYDKKTGKVEYVEIIEYDSNGKKSKVIEKDGDGKIKKISVYKYDENGFRTEKLVYDIKGNLKSKDVYVYEK